MKPCIVVTGEENGHEYIEQEDWHDIKPGRKTAPSSKTSNQKKPTNSKTIDQVR